MVAWEAEVAAGTREGATFLRVLWDTPSSILHTGFRPDPRLVKLGPETPAFTFGDLLVDTQLAPRSS